MTKESPGDDGMSKGIFLGNYSSNKYLFWELVEDRIDEHVNFTRICW